MSLTEEAYQKRRWGRYPNLRAMLADKLMTNTSHEWWSSASYSYEEELLDALKVSRTIDRHRELVSTALREQPVCTEVGSELHTHTQHLRYFAEQMLAMADSLDELLKT